MKEIKPQRLLKYLLRFLTLHGLSPFIITSERSVYSVRTPKRLLIYSVVVSILINFVIISWTVYCEHYTYQIYQDDPIVFLTVTFEYIFGITNGIALFMLHNVHHVKIAKLIKQATKLNEKINKFTASSTMMLNKRVTKIIKIKICAVVLQILAMLLTYPAQTFAGWMLYAYPQSLIMLTGVIYIFGFMMLSLNSIICINAKLKFIQKSIRYNDKTSATVTWNDNYIDEVSVLFNVANKFTIRMNGLYGWNFTLTLVGSTLFYMINSVMILKLSQVTIHYVIKEYLYSVSNVVFYSIEIGNIVFVADVISKEFQEMQHIVLKCPNTNLRKIKKSIETISIQMNQSNLEMNVCGMSTIQKSMIIAIGSTVVSYLTILVQFKFKQ